MAFGVPPIPYILFHSNNPKILTYPLLFPSQRLKTLNLATPPLLIWNQNDGGYTSK